MSLRTWLKAAWICVSLVKTLITAPKFLTRMICRHSEPHTYDMKLKREMCCYKHTERTLMLPVRGGDKERRHGSKDLTMQISSLGWQPSESHLGYLCLVRCHMSIPHCWEMNTPIWMTVLGEPHSFVFTSIEDSSPAPKKSWLPHSQSLFLQKIKIKWAFALRLHGRVLSSLSSQLKSLVHHVGLRWFPCYHLLSVHFLWGVSLCSLPRNSVT